MNIEAWTVLCALASGGGFKEAALRGELDLPACSRLVAKLEQELQLRLVDHTMRPVQLTEEARTLLPAAREIVNGHRRILKYATDSGRETASLKLSIPVNVSRASVHEHLRSYRLLVPSLRFSIVSDCDHEDVLDRRIDIAYLPYRPPEEGLVLFEAGTAFNVPLVSRGYAKRFGIPNSPDDLKLHRVIVRADRNYPETRTLVLGGREVLLQCAGIAFAGDVLSGKEALLNGEGVALDLSFSSCRDEIESGLLFPVLRGWHRPVWELTVAVSAAQADSRVLKFAQWFAQSERKGLARRNAFTRNYVKALWPDLPDDF